MPLEYDIDNKLKALAPVIDEHAEWFGQTTKRIFFPKDFKGEDKISVPDSFQAWVDKARGYDFIEEVTLNDIKTVFEELHVVATGLTDKAGYTEEPITLKEYDDFTGLYEHFIFKLRRLEQDCAMSDSGLDIESGLRSKRAMEVDIVRELERRARRGNPFTLALARINHFDEISSKANKEQVKAAVEKLGILIKKVIRSFDDAYRSGDDEFIMSLKHADTTGGTAAVNRLRSFLKNENIIFDLGGHEVPLTMSYCVAEPLPGDTLKDLLANMRADLDKWDEDGGDTALEYHEQSPLQRYIGDAE